MSGIRLSEIGTPVELDRVFGDKPNFEWAVRETQSAIYERGSMT